MSTSESADGYSNSLFLCRICKKPFSKKTSRDRHVPYCRQTRDKVRLRGKPCLHCGSAKKKCTFQMPCARCAQRGLQCDYGDSHVPTAQEFMDMGVPTSVELIESVNLSAIAVSEVPRNVQDLGNARDQTPSTLRRLPTRRPLSYADVGLWSKWTTKDENFPVHTFSNELALQSTPEQMRRVRFSNPITQNNANHIIRILECMPHMMLRRETFPAFIHSYKGVQTSLPEPLLTCMDISQLFTSRRKSNNSLIWRTCQAELFRLRNSAAEFSSKYEVLAALQAGTVYIIMMYIDRETVSDADIGQALLSCFLGVECLRKACNEPFCHDEWASPSETWNDWVFAESRRRLACIWFIMRQVIQVHVDNFSCETTDGFRAIPLPSSKLLWGATSFTEWETELEEFFLPSRAGLRTIGDLYKLMHRTGEGSDPQLVQWNLGTDALGTMINLASVFD